MSAPAHSRPWALVADDEDLGRLLLAECATAAGFAPLIFDNGTAALAAALSNNVAILLLDVEMPGLSGFEVCRRVRAAKRASLPIVMVTGLDDKKAINAAFEAGATDFISKPVNWSLLPHRLAYFLRNAHRESKILTLVEALPDALWVVAPDGKVRWTQRGHARSRGPNASTAADDESLSTVIPNTRQAEALAVIQATAHDGQPRQMETRAAPDSTQAGRSAELRFTRVEGGDVLIVQQDTSERTAAARRIERLAFYDELTGLPNRQHCIEMTSRCLAKADQCGTGIALLYVDLNSFKRINDTFGHSVGDVVLQRVADAISSVVEPMNSEDATLFLARLGGDEFVVIAEHSEARRLGVDTAAAICHALSVPIAYETVEFLTSPSIGISVYPEDGHDVETLLKHADTAMYQAKVSGGPSVVSYAPAMSARLRDSLELETHLRRALRDGALDLRFQPKFRLVDGVLVGAEALLRWYDSDLGEVSPNRFIPIAEESGLIIDLGAWVMRAVCAQLRTWQDAGVAVPIAVNVSGKELLFADPSRVVTAETERAGIAASLIEVEITESVFVTDLSAARSSVDRIRQLGCRIALDDFGTGYSSLSYLTRFPPDRLKIDRSFIANIDRSDSDAAIVKAILSLAKTLNLQVTAEGIERAGQLQWLKSFGCDEAQGYLLAKPMPAKEMEERFLRPLSGDQKTLEIEPNGTQNRNSSASRW